MADKTRASVVARETMLAALPAGAPAPFRDIVRAAFEGKNTIIADLVMFDGLPAQARFTRWALGWSHGWNSMPGGDISLESGEWVRVERTAA